MKLIIVRHADPDYEHDSLTDKGWREAEYLSEFLSKYTFKDIYVSPLGRAQDTASLTLDKMHKKAITLDWLKEFDAPITKPNCPEEKTITWDWLPSDWTKEPKYYNCDKWFDTSTMTEDNVKEKYEWVTKGLDGLLAEHGYIRDGRIYKALSPNNDIILIFCHFGLECVLLSHLLNISPMVLWHSCAAAPSSFTILSTEERRQGIASFRMLSFGERSHLYQNNEVPSFSARFRECYFNENERQD